MDSGIGPLKVLLFKYLFLLNNKKTYILLMIFNYYKLYYFILFLL